METQRIKECEVIQYLVSGCCLICQRYIKNKGKCSGKVFTKGCLGFKKKL